MLNEAQVTLDLFNIPVALEAIGRVQEGLGDIDPEYTIWEGIQVIA